MIIYTVRIELDEAIEAQWYEWMVGQHIPDVLKTGYFVSAGLARVLEPEPTRPTFRIEYRCRNAAAYRAYVADHAQRLQAEHSQRFTSRFTASRSLLAERECWDADSSDAVINP